MLFQIPSAAVAAGIKKEAQEAHPHNLKKNVTKIAMFCKHLTITF